MGDVDVFDEHEQEELTAEVDMAVSDGLYVPEYWTDQAVADFESALAVQTEDKRGVKMLRKRFETFKRHYDLLSRDNRSLQSTLNFINGVRAPRQYKGDSNKHARKIAVEFFSGMSEALLYKQAKVFGINPAMYDDNAQLIDALVDKRLSNHEE